MRFDHQIVAHPINTSQMAIILIALGNGVISISLLPHVQLTAITNQLAQVQECRRMHEQLIWRGHTTAKTIYYAAYKF